MIIISPQCPYLHIFLRLSTKVNTYFLIEYGIIWRPWSEKGMICLIFQSIFKLKFGLWCSKRILMISKSWMIPKSFHSVMKFVDPSPFFRTDLLLKKRYQFFLLLSWEVRMDRRVRGKRNGSDRAVAPGLERSWQGERIAGKCREVSQIKFQPFGSGENSVPT